MASSEADYAAVGMEAFEEAIRRDEEALRRCRASIKSYQALDRTLQHINDTPRRTVMAPVCGGLAYFPAQLVRTNELMVLLGENYFAERSAAQTRDIVARRLAFLEVEEHTLKTEISAARLKLEFAIEENTAMELGKEPAAFPQREMVAESSRRSTNPATKIDPMEEIESEMERQIAAEMAAHRAEGAKKRAAAGDDSDDGELSSTLDDEDHLTLKELQEIEDDMWKYNWDDETAERKIQEHQMAKKRRRLMVSSPTMRAASANVFADSKTGNTAKSQEEKQPRAAAVAELNVSDLASTRPPSLQASSAEASPSPDGGSSRTPKYISPGDIGKGYVSPQSSTKRPAEQSAASTSNTEDPSVASPDNSVPLREEIHVAVSAGRAAESFRPKAGDAAKPLRKEPSLSHISQSSQPPKRRSNHPLGEVKERFTATADDFPGHNPFGPPPPLPPPLTFGERPDAIPERVPPPVRGFGGNGQPLQHQHKRKSRFKMQMEAQQQGK